MKIINTIKSVYQNLEFPRLLAIILLGFFILTTNLDSMINSGHNSNAVSRRLDQVVHQDQADRPKTTGEWSQEARETADHPGEKAQRIAKESGEALKQFGSMYVDTIKRSAEELKNNQQ